MAELADARDLKSRIRKSVGVRFPLLALIKHMIIIKTDFYEHKYDGNIEIYIDDNFIYVDWTQLFHIEGDWIFRNTKGFDTFWIEDVLSIRGEYDYIQQI